jgi:hypothetical protein
LTDHNTPALRTIQGFASGDLDILPVQRAGSLERDRFVNHLNKLHGLGYLDADECGHRVTAALSAPTISALNALISDLPGLTLPESKPLGETMLRPARKPITLLLASAVLSLMLTIVPVSLLIGASSRPVISVVLAFTGLTAGLVWLVANFVWWNQMYVNGKRYR